MPEPPRRLTNAAARLMQAYQEALLTLQKIRTGGKQVVVVQRVEVSGGGQAVIAGSMNGGNRGLTVRRAEKKRRGWLKNGNRPGDFSKAPRCGAKTRRGRPCQCPAMANGRCRLHGGLSTGLKTAAGIERIRRAVTKHGYYSKAATEERQRAHAAIKAIKELRRIMTSPERQWRTRRIRVL